MIELSEILLVLSDQWVVILLFFMVAILYSSVGFGGGSSYLAVLALTGLSFIQFRAISLLCNIVVVSGGTYIFAKNGHYNWKKVVPLALASIPFAFIGGYLKISQTFFFILLGVTLIIAAISMWISKYLAELSVQKNESTIIKDSIFWKYHWICFRNGWNRRRRIFITLTTFNQMGIHQSVLQQRLVFLFW